MRLKFVLATVFLIPLFLSGQSGSLRFNHYSVNEGLSQGNVTSIMQDHLGLMWFGTWDGLNVYDGFKNVTFKERAFKSEKIRGVLINNIMEIDSKRVAIGTYSGMSIYNRDKREFEYFLSGKEDNNVRLIKQVEGKLLITSNNRLMQFDLQTHLISSVDSGMNNKWNSINQKRKNGVNRSEYLYSKLFELTEKFPEEISLFAELLSKLTVNDLIIDLDNEKVFFGCDEGLFSYDLSQHKLSDPLLSATVKSLQYLNEQLYVGTQRIGLIVFNAKENRVTANYTYDELSKRSVTGNFIRTMYIDRQQNLWLSVLGSGVNYCNLKPKLAHTILTYSDLPLDLKQNNYIKAVAEDRDSILWVATVTGTVWLLDNENRISRTIIPKEIDPQLQPNSIQGIYVNTFNRKFLLTEKGLFVSDGTGVFKKALTDSLNESQQYLQTMISLNDSLNMIGSRSGLMLYNEKTNRLMPLGDSIVKSSTIHYLYKDNSGQVYVNRLFDGIEIFKFDKDHLVSLHAIDVKLNLKSCYETNDTLYFATTKGIMVVSKRSHEFYMIDESDGLPNQNIYCLLPDKNNAATFWCSSNRGVFRYNVVTGKLFTLGLNDGLSSLEFNTGAYAIRKNGQYVFGSTDGLTILQPEYLPQNIEENKLIAVNLNFDKASASEVMSYIKGFVYTVPYENNGFSCRLLQVNFPNFEAPIRYQLVGHDRTWNSGVNPIEVRYSNLHEGKYDFVAQYYDREKGWLSIQLFKIELLPPWYRSWWAYVMYLVFISGIVIILNRIYINKKLQRQREILVRKEVLMMERDRISADLHDDLGSTLSSISIYSEAIKNKLKQKDSEKVVELIDKIGDNARESITNLSDIVWSINPMNDSGELVFSRMESFATSILPSKNIGLDFKYEEVFLKKEFSMEFRQNLFLIFKEAINNIAKYSEAKLVTVTISHRNSELELKIHDNGHGFRIEESTTNSGNGKPGGNGLRNMKLRATQLHGQLLINSSPSGTTIELIVPLV